MWNDIETTTDYLHFSVVSGTIAELIMESGNNPISIGVSGDWGSGKSSMVKMIGNELNKRNNSEKHEFLFLEFNAWLYQGYDDAKSSLLQAVTKKLSDEMKERNIKEKDKTLWEKFKMFSKRVNWLKVSKIALPLFSGLIPGSAPAGVIANLYYSIKNSVENGGDAHKNADLISSNMGEFLSGFEGVLKDDETNSAAQQIEELRKEFEEILEKLDVRLVVLVDDLDRCLPETAISTLEAMRLLLFVKRTAFIIAADEQMIRNGVRAHFGEVELSDDLVTSYFDKLIQVPITVPRPGIPEVKVYMYLLFLEMEVKKGKITKDTQRKIQDQLGKALSKAWEKGVSFSEIHVLLENEAGKREMEEYAAISEQLASILVSSNKIKGNPRLIKRFLNALEIRRKVAKLNEMTVDSGILIKMLLFERCASGGAFEYLAEIVSKSKDGKPEEIKNLEEDLKNGKEYNPPDPRWKDGFLKDWLLLEPKLSESDLRPYSYLSRDKAITFAAFDKLSVVGEDVFRALQQVKGIQYMTDLVTRIKNLGKEESEIMLRRVLVIGRSEQWSIASLGQALHIIKAYPELESQLVVELTNLPPKARMPFLANAIRDMDWAKEMLQQWSEDPNTPDTTKNVLKGGN